jgi:hypothetical protein
MIVVRAIQLHRADVQVAVSAASVDQLSLGLQPDQPVNPIADHSLQMQFVMNATAAIG